LDETKAGLTPKEADTIPKEADTIPKEADTIPKEADIKADKEGQAMCVWNEDQRQTLISTFTYIVDVVKLTFGCLLSVVVPQRCMNRSDEICTLYDNLFDLIPYNIFTVTYNFITMGCLIGFYTVEYKREKWCIEYLDYHDHEPHDALERSIQRYPTLRSALLAYNHYYYRIACLSGVLVVTNILFSAFLVLYYYYLDYRSITSLVTNSLLVVDKLYTSYKIAKVSNEERCAISAYLIVPIIYNGIDDDHRRTPPATPHAPKPTPSPPPSFRVQVNLATFQTMMELYHRPIKK
jgi:hypothetical protein